MGTLPLCVIERYFVKENMSEYLSILIQTCRRFQRFCDVQTHIDA